MGVISTSRLEAGEKFGPVPPTLTLAEPTMLIGHRTCDTLPDIHTVKLDLHCYSSGERLAEWVPYVLSARCAAEQNMEATVDGGLLYFSVTRDVDDGSELLIWYSDQLAQLIGVPALDNDCRSGESYRCPKCGDQFVYPNCLRAHLRFRCRYRKHQPKTSDVIACRQPSPRATSGQLTPSSDDANGGKMVDAMTSLRAVKRKADNEDDGKVVATKRRSPPTDVVLRAGVVQGPRIFDAGRELKLNGFVGVGTPQAPCRSAFQRVDKAPLGPTTPPSPSQATSSSSPSDVAGIAPMLPLSVVTTFSLTTLDTTSTARPAGTGSSGSGGLFMFPAAMQAERLNAPMMLGAGFVASNSRTPEAFYPTICNESAYARNFVTNDNNNMTGNDVKLLNQSSTGIAANQSRHCRLPPPTSLPLSVPAGYRTSNPMMEKLLQLVSPVRPTQPSSKSTSGAGSGSSTLSASFPSLQLAQNWCAKCNTSFRMTSDLVYHMRTHHKRDLEPASQRRRKDDNKLRCDVCAEMFKERHHLTRHMTSHT